MDKFRNYIIEQSFTDDEYPKIFRALKDISKDRQLIESMTPSDEVLKENFNEYSLNRVERWLSKLSEDNFKTLTTSKSKEKIKKVIGEKKDVGERALDIFNAWIDGDFCVENKILSNNGTQLDEIKVPKGISDEAKQAIKVFLDNIPENEKDEDNERIKAAIDGIIKAIDSKNENYTTETAKQTELRKGDRVGFRVEHAKQKPNKEDYLKMKGTVVDADQVTGKVKVKWDNPDLVYKKAPDGITYVHSHNLDKIHKLTRFD